MAIHFMSSKDTDEAGVMCSKCDNVEIIINDKVNEVFKNFLNHFIVDFKST